jgi:hypothetical protein
MTVRHRTRAHHWLLSPPNSRAPGGATVRLACMLIKWLGIQAKFDVGRGRVPNIRGAKFWMPLFVWSIGSRRTSSVCDGSPTISVSER